MIQSIRFRFAAGLLVAAAFYLGAPGAEAASGRLTFKVGDQMRSAFVTERYRTKRKLRPAIIVLGESPRASPAARRNLRFLDFTRRGGILVYAEPAGGNWNIASDGGAPGEVAYLRALVAKLRSDSLADPRRIYLFGVGSGGMVALQAACREARLFAGVAGALTSLGKEQAAACAPSRPVSAMLLAGDADAVLPFNGGKASLRGFSGEVAPVEETARAFARAAFCSGPPVRAEIADRDRADASRIVIDRFPGCRARVSVVRVQGGGHFLPVQTAGGATIAGQNRDASTTALILSFFRL
ncbi:MAG: phospholipase [Beijerinckiaceae bacterium]|nr:phospholipase [Beijerinckiaceae bacterium]